MKRLGLSPTLEIALIAGFIAGIAASLAPTVSPARQRPLRQACADNLRRIGQAVRAYAEDYDGYIYPQVYADGLWGMPAGVAPPASTTFQANIWATTYLPYCGNSSSVFRCPFENARERTTGQGDVSFQFGPGIPPATPESRKRVSYVYIGLDLWKSGAAGLENPASAFKYMRRVTDKSAISGTGWLARDKDFTVSNHLATSHGISPYAVSDAAHWIQGVESNVLLLDGSVKAHPNWDG